MKRPFLQFILHVQPCWQHSNWRKKHSLVFLVLLCLAFAFGSGVANADDTSLGWNGGGVQLIQNNNITMVSEHVNIRVGRWANVPTYASFNWSYVSCSFTFRNNSAKAQQVLMGFPDEYVPDPEFDGDRNANGTHLTDFTTQINGRVVPTQHLKNTNTKEPYAYWQEWKMQFQPQQTVVVRNTFWVGNTVSVLYGFTIDYILKTGRAWNGPIGRAEITVDLSRLPNCRVLTKSPSGAKTGANGTYTWVLTQFEPKDNISLSAHISNDKATAFASNSRWPFTSKRLVADRDLQGLSRDDLRLMRNEIYARHGMEFRDPLLQEYFDSFTWYKASDKSATQIEATLNAVERQNTERIAAREAKAS